MYQLQQTDGHDSFYIEMGDRQYLTPKGAQKIVELKQAGKDKHEIADAIGMKVKTVNYWLRSDKRLREKAEGRRHDYTGRHSENEVRA